MMPSACGHLDGYVGRWLSEPELLAFVAHLGSCPRCRQAVEEQRLLDQLLAQAAAPDPHMPAGLVERVEARLVRARRRRLYLRATALAAVLLVAVGISLWLLNKHAIRNDLVETPPIERPVHASVARVMTRVVVSPSSGLTAVPIESKNPAVTIVWLFPGRLRTPDRRSVPAASSTRSRS
jgi:predicted anti-sigma-YlaC factor YlaD